MMILQRLAQMARLMVGIGDYQAYRQHMQQQHPEQVPMTEAEYVRARQAARYPSRAGDIKRCPC